MINNAPNIMHLKFVFTFSFTGTCKCLISNLYKEGNSKPKIYTVQ